MWFEHFIELFAFHNGGPKTKNVLSNELHFMYQQIQTSPKHSLPTNSFITWAHKHYQEEIT